jgi:uncharacterized protein YabN with tetrapyrrole methylase and pyrophosphatase domain
MEYLAEGRGQHLAELTLEQMDELWAEAKAKLSS